MLWKCWRDLRVFVLAGLGWLALLAVIALSHPHITERSPQFAPSGMDVIAALMRVFVNIQTFAFAFLALGMGTRGIGRDIGIGAGSFVLTRPARRSSFVWTEWLSGMAAVALLSSLAGLLYWSSVRYNLLRIAYIRLGPNYQRMWVNAGVSLRTATIASLCAFLFLALIFTITHCGTVVFRHSMRGLLFCIGSFVAYLLLIWEIYLHHPAWSPHMPDLLFQPFIEFPQDVRLVPGLTSSVLERLAILPLFPLVGWWFLRRAEV